MMSLTVIVLAVLCLGLLAAIAIAVAVVWMQSRQESNLHSNETNDASDTTERERQ